MTDDLISRQAVLDELNKWDWQELYLPIHFKENIIDELPSVTPKAERTGHWIPVSERLPKEENNHYWICTDCGYQCECRWTNVNHFWTNLTTDWHWHIMDIPQYSKVIAWMPLPKSYEPQERGDKE